MENNTVIGVNATYVWQQWYHRLSKQNIIQPSRAGNVVGEVLNAISILKNPRNNMVQGERKMPVKYAIGELLWYLSGSNKLSAIAPYAKFWESISDDGETVNSAYGHKISSFYGFDQWDYVKNLLIADKYSRQAVIHIKNPSCEPSKDVPCTVSIQFHIRQGKLHCTTYMRSNDIWLGLPYDIFTFTCLQIKMAMELDVELGEYTHISSSLHLYEKDLKKDVSHTPANNVVVQAENSHETAINFYHNKFYDNDGNPKKVEKAVSFFEEAVRDGGVAENITESPTAE